jgi:hypothetical protein
MFLSARPLAACCAAGLFLVPPLTAGINPDLSAVGQLRGGIQGENASFDPDEAALSLGESELILDAALNPYLRGSFTVSAGEEGFEMEEAYAVALRGLGYGLGLKAGKYRLGFGKLNAVHPHAYPFLDVPDAWAALMPGGEEGFNEAAVQASVLLPTPGDWASTVSVDLIEGKSFHPHEDRTRLGWLGRWSNSLLLGEKAALEAGVSGATGLDAPTGDARGWLAGGDLKVKLYLGGTSQLVLQGEGLFRRSHTVDSAAPGPISHGQYGFYAFADWKVNRWNAGLLYDQFQHQEDEDRMDRSVKAFGGFALWEETTLLRAAYGISFPDGGDAVHGLALQFLFSMGPHKPHQF